MVPWSQDGVTLRPAQPEQLAFGPQAVAVDPQGDALVLDSVRGRLVRVGGATTALPFVLPPASEDLIGFADGAIAVYRPVDRGVHLFGREGQPQGSLRVPSVLTEVGLLEADASHRVWVQDAFQESALLGSPHAPLDDASVLRSRRDGVWGGVEVIVKAGVARLRVLGQGERKTIERELVIGRGVRSGLIVGRAGATVCARTERLIGGATVRVAREAVCVDTTTGRETLRTALPAPGLYAPRRELALGGSPLQLAHIEPRAEGLVVRRWAVGR